jgi:NADH:ubiquinone oxidoreductase subunit F (NADH-binding)
MRAPATVRRLLDAPPGPVPWRGPALVDDAAAAGLTGRGGGGFPTARKLAAARAARRPVVVANGAEGEPACAKDRHLLATAPHLVLDGLQLVADAVGAERAVAYLAPDAVAAVRAALAGRAGDRVPVEVVAAGEHFVAGEETAVLAALGGRPGLPQDKFRRPALHGRPALVQNVETLAQLTLVARHGPAWFGAGNTALVTVSGGVPPGVHEIAHGTPLRSVPGLERHDGPVLVGGFHGAWLAGSEVADATFSRGSLARVGATPGAGVLVALPRGASGLVETARIVGYLAGQSARQCGPCVNGLPRMADVLGRVAAGERHLLGELHRLAGLVDGRGACHHPDGTVRLVRSALRVFA